MITTGSQDLDKHFQYCNSINCIYGQAATGKTNFCLFLASKLAKEKKVFFIDTENTFSPERVNQFAGEDVLNNIFVIKAKDFEEQHKAIENLLPIKGMINLIIVDSLNVHYRKELQQKNQNANNKLSKQFSILSELARSGIPVILTCQVYTKFDNTIQLVGGEMVRNWSDCIIRLENDFKRKLILEKHPEIENKDIDFEIKENGIFSNKSNREKI